MRVASRPACQYLAMSGGRVARWSGARRSGPRIALLAGSLSLLVVGMAAGAIELGPSALASPSEAPTPMAAPPTLAARPSLAGALHTGPAPASTGSNPSNADPAGSHPTGTDPAGPNPSRALALAMPPGPVPLAGCPLPYRPPYTGPPAAPPHPAGLVPESALPAPPPPAPRTHQLSALAGKGVWIWQLGATEGGDASRIVARARTAGLHQLWVRVGDSFDGFYAGPQLDSLVPAAHRAGIAVIGWGFPYLYDPVSDAGWSRAALAWRGPGGSALDAFSPDIETASEGVALSPARVITYLGLVRPADGRRPLVATVFPPNDHFLATYPYAAMAPYVDAFAPMAYWGCQQPGQYAALALQRLAAMAPIHLVGQGYDMAGEGGRKGSPSAAEVLAFLDGAKTGGAQGASLYVWQSLSDPEWSALGGFAWKAAGGRP